MTGRWDAIVVGAGVGGLVCAGYLAACGMRVLVVEQHDVAGGNAHVFRRRRAYHFDVGTHYLGDCGPDGVLPAVLHGLGVADRVDFHPMDPDGFDRIVTPGVRLDVPVGWSRYGERLTAALPGDAAALRRFLDLCVPIAAASRGRLLAPREHGDLGALPAAVVAWSRRTLRQLFDHCGLSERARTVLSAQLGNYGSFPAETPVVTHVAMLDAYLRGAHYPAGGGQVLVAALVEAIEAHGGVLWTRARADRITIEDGAVTGVALTDGRTPRAPLVVSNADYRRTVLELCPGAFPEPVVARTRDAAMTMGLATLFVALDTDEPRRNANTWWWATEDLADAEARIRSGADEVPFVFLSFSSVKDPVPGASCPPGHTNFQIMTLCPPDHRRWGVDPGPGGRYRREPAYLAAKERFTAGMLAAAEQAIGPFRDRIVHLEVATTLTQERYTLSSGGSPYGLGRWGRVGQRPDLRTGVEGLFLAGQNTRYGSGIGAVAVSGIACASAILGRDLLPEAHRGTVFATPALLPDRDASFDPLRVSRGLARRDARGLAGLTRPRAVT
jgi:all-trans-retinol 13,14-reductase